jgi:myosin protein heavy chain
VDNARIQCIQLERKSKNFDKIIAEWKQKLDEVTARLESSQKDYRFSLISSR